MSEAPIMDGGPSSAKRKKKPRTLAKVAAKSLKGHPLNCHCSPCATTATTRLQSDSCSVATLSMISKRRLRPVLSLCVCLTCTSFLLAGSLRFSAVGTNTPRTRKSAAFHMLILHEVEAGTTMISGGGCDASPALPHLAPPLPSDGGAPRGGWPGGGSAREPGGGLAVRSRSASTSCVRRVAKTFFEGASSSDDREAVRSSCSVI
mmetsp:Transcript_40787/g.100722  ORF Transcript_40787/g.100722 Transcript_40787/m.100722 type:complete len:205 (+) Transcript_40787:142-756(+)